MEPLPFRIFHFLPFQNQVSYFIDYVDGRYQPDGWINSSSSLAYFVMKGFLHVLRHSFLIAIVYQPIVHLIIALNRLTAFAFPLRHSTIWSRRAVTVSTLGLTVFAMLFVGTPPVYIKVLFALDPTAGNSPNADMSWDDKAVRFYASISKL